MDGDIIVHLPVGRQNLPNVSENVEQEKKSNRERKKPNQINTIRRTRTYAVTKEIHMTDKQINEESSYKAFSDNDRHICGHSVAAKSQPVEIESGTRWANQMNDLSHLVSLS
jgi:hypothetical protein